MYGSSCDIRRSCVILSIIESWGMAINITVLYLCQLLHHKGNVHRFENGSSNTHHRTPSASTNLETEWSPPDLQQMSQKRIFPSQDEFQVLKQMLCALWPRCTAGRTVPGILSDINDVFTPGWWTMSQHQKGVLEELCDRAIYVWKVRTVPRQCPRSQTEC